jgi:peptide/nickel transport system substrate-binding protein
MPLVYTSGVPSLDDEAQALQAAFDHNGIQAVLSQAPANTVLSDAYACFGMTTKKCPASSTALSLFASPSYTYVPIYYPDGDSLFGCGGSTNGGNYCNQQIEGLINKIITGDTATSATAMSQYQIQLAKQVPVLWFPNAAYQISAISPKLGGVTAQDSTAHIYPSTWYVKS